MKVLIDTSAKTTAFIEDAGTTIVHPEAETVVVQPTGTAINPATGQPLTTVPGYVSEIAGFLTSTQGDQPAAAGENTGGAKPALDEIAFVNGGVLSTPYPQGTQKRWLVTGVINGGLVAFKLGKIAGGKSGIGRIALAAEGGGDATALMSFATEPGVLVGPAVILEMGQAPEPGAAFSVGAKSAAEFPVDRDIYVNVRFIGAATASRMHFEVAAHDRGQ